MISLSQTRYGSAASPGNARQGNSRRWRSYQASSAAASGSAANRCCDDGFVFGVLVRIGDMNEEQEKPTPPYPRGTAKTSAAQTRDAPTRDAPTRDAPDCARSAPSPRGSPLRLSRGMAAASSPG